MPDQINENKRRAALLVGAAAAVVAIVLGLLGLLVLGWIGLVVGVVIAVAAGVFLTRRSTAVVLARVGGQPADDVAHARLRNIVDGLCVASGLPVPVLLVVDEPALNTLACGRNPRDAAVVVTTGLLAGLNRIELEGVMAHELTHVKNLDILPATLAAAVPGGQQLARLTGLGRAGDTTEALADLQAVGMTRYPPGLLAALEKLQADTATMQPRAASITHLWLKPPETGGRMTAPLDERIEALKEL